MDQNETTFQKVDLWISLCNELQRRLKRRLEEAEIIAIGFILDERFSFLKDKSSLMEKVFEIDSSDKEATINYKFHLQLKRSLENRYKEAYTGNFGEEPDSYKAYREQQYQKLLALNETIIEYAERAYKLNEENVPLVGVPSYVIPTWVWQNRYIIEQLCFQHKERN